MFNFDTMWKNIKTNKNNKRNIKDVEYESINLNEYMILDVRSKREFGETHLNGAINIPLPEIKKNIGKIIKDKKAKILVYCEYGIRSKKAVDIIQKMGYVEVYNLKGGLENI